MFGSKIRSWMENHIVRPRKKGNKNKNSNGTSTASSNLTQNGHGHKGATGFTIYHGDGTTTTASITATAPNGSISSPARRREVSPIQNHTTSRFGWQSPSEESSTMSPKSDNFLYVQHSSVKAQTLSATPSSKGSQHQRNCIGGGISNGGVSSGSCNAIITDHTGKEFHHHQNQNQHQNQQQYQQQQQPQGKRTKTLSPSSMFRRKSAGNAASATNAKHPSSQIHPVAGVEKSKQKYLKGGCSNSHYEEIQNNNNQQQHQQQQQQQQQSHRKEYILEQKDLTSYHNGDAKNESTTPRYGKLLPSKMAGDGYNSSQHQQQQQQQFGSYDSLNANIAYAAVNGDERVPSNNNNGGAGGHVNGGYPSGAVSNVVLRNGYEANRQMLRSSRYNGTGPGGVGGPGTGAVAVAASAIAGGVGPSNGILSNGPVNHHPMGHIMNSLSSPESAYSTGYSTDGTSPGATYTPPEYYINMRTGTHYFPKSVNTLAIEAQRYKFGLNKIEEMSPQDPLPNNNNNNNHRRTESFDSGQSKIPGFGIPDPEFFQNQAKLFEQQNNQQNNHQLQQQQQNQQQQHQQQINVGSHSPLPLRNTIVIPTLKGFESPSPRQRCRIRTNPWYSTTDTSSSGTTIATTQAFLAAKKMELDASSSSSGIKSSSEAGASDKNEKNEKTSDESTSETSSSSTEVENLQRTYSPNTIRRKKQLGELLLTSSCRSEMHSLHQQGSHHHIDSDEDATLNEMMGKFDESYVYEKETDILSSSDSDPTDCASDLDTGQDAGDECDTDDMLDIEFIDTALVGQEAAMVKTYQLPRRASRQRHMKTYPGEDASKRKKKLMKTRKKSTESKGRGSPMKNSRESRSLGGTPVCLRRNQSADNKRSLKAQTLSTRCSSLTFTEVHAIRSKFIAIGDSEKALLRADLEADVKYRQLIHEAETILVSMKTSALSIPRETPVASPRRVCNPLANKRVEMLKQCEADIKRELLKQQQKSLDAENNISIDNGALNKRLESLKYETNSAPNSPKSSRFSPRKTHITNFINQNAPPEVPPRRSSIPEPPPRSPQLQVNGQSIKGRSASPLSHRRRFRSQSPKKQQPICSDSDSDDNSNSSMKQQNLSRRSRSLRSNTQDEDDRNNRNCLPEIQKITIYNESDYTNRNVKPALMSFKSFGGTATTISMSSYCPQSEPLKRKVYRGSSSFERIKKSLDLDSGKFMCIYNVSK
ncbi:uncharacterized protein LOC129949266 isoform X1 [Eupeodes corollae]|uniref:uncharacterized protein LOC129949266 isoform X1 n=1 Tax=Eupeodes corollae TaxID=290404 RepID=UPI002492C42F|nr:uncharacterized protein LOC129949266 isoform X1 [Eupeodes corollae]XP_055916592.1 uncharacterized protein LOC129949266 isoform X1 [Eupeodes corollae]